MGAEIPTLLGHFGKGAHLENEERALEAFFESSGRMTITTTFWIQKKPTVFFEFR